MTMADAMAVEGWDQSLTTAHYDSSDGWNKIELRKRYYELAALDPIHVISVMSLRASGVQHDALVIDVGSSYPNFLMHWRSSGHLGELIAIEPNAAQLSGAKFFQLDISDVRNSGNNFYVINGEPDTEDLRGIKIFRAGMTDLGISFTDPETLSKRSLRGAADVVTSNLAMYHVPLSEQAGAHAQIKSLLKPVTGIYAEITRGKDNKRGIHADDVLIGQALEEVMGQGVKTPSPIHYPYTIDSAITQLPNSFDNVYIYKQSSYIRLTTSEEVDIKLDCHRTVRDLYVTSSGQTPTPEQHEEAIEIAIGERIRLAREGIKPIIDYADEALFIASDSPIDTTNFNHRFTPIK